MKSVMIDIETLSTEPDACVVAIGAAKFDEHGVTDTLSLIISKKDWHGHIDHNTVAWWMEQSSDAKAATFNQEGAMSAISAQQQLKDFIQGADEVWANSPSFDLVILKKWWKRVSPNTHMPVSHRNERCCRTIYREADRLCIELGDAWKMGIAHNAVDDAANQARAIIEYRKQVGGPQR